MRFRSESQPSICCNIVLVDDEPFVLQVHAEMVRALGHSTTTFACPLQAFDYLKANAGTVDLLITDYHMPEINGLDLIAKLHKEGIHLPSMILTGFPDEVDANRAKAHNARVIGKPISIHVLSGLLQSFPLMEIAKAGG